MKRLAFKYRFYPTETQKAILNKTFGCCRLVYNKALSLRSDSWYKESIRIKPKDVSLQLTRWKKEEEFSFLNEVSSVPLQQSLRHLDSAFNRFFKKQGGYPTFKKRNGKQSATFTRNALKFDLKTKELILPKEIGKLNIKWSRPLKHQPSTITVCKDCSDRYFVSFSFEKAIIAKEKISKKIGLDLGIKDLIVTSDEEKITNNKYLKKHEERLAFLQKNLSRKVKGSRNRNKARLKVAKKHAKISDSRKDHLHKMTSKLVNENQVIAIESLEVSGMLKNKRLAKHISDSSWYELKRMLQYKCDWYGRTLVEINQYYPSTKRCNNCGYTLSYLDLKERSWKCPECNKIHDRDINAAKNIKEAGLALLACGDGVRPKLRMQ
jgi:putative transposase